MQADRMKYVLLTIAAVASLVVGMSVILAKGRPLAAKAPQSPSDTYDLAVWVTDANTGWALYAGVTITPPGETAATYWTYPWDGAYTVTLQGGATYSVSVTVWDGIPGYISQARSVTLVGDTVENFALSVDGGTCSAPGYGLESSTVLQEDFESWPLTDWRIVNAGGDCVWQAGGAEISAETNYTGGGGEYADADSDRCGSLTTMDTDLQTPVLDLSHVSQPVLEFLSDMKWYTNGVYVVDLSLDGGTTWPINLLHRYGESYLGPENIRLPLTGAAGQSNVRVRFRYVGSFDWWWQIDSVTVYDACGAPSGGLLAGAVHDVNTNYELTGAQIHNSLGQTVMAQVTPGENLIPESFYAIYVPPGSQTVTATMANYVDSVVTNYPVVNGRTQPQGFSLPAGWPYVTSESLHAVVMEGQSTTLPLTITNGSPQVSFVYEIVYAQGWLSSDPVSGTVSALGTSVVDIGFDGAAVAGLGDYHGTITVRTNTPYSDMEMQVMLTVMTSVYLPLAMRSP